MVGRSREIQELNRLYDSGKAEFVAIYGRRRIGKTYLVDQLFKNRISFRHSGISPVDGEGGGGLVRQLDHFYLSLRLQGMKKGRKPSSWLEAFYLLEKHLQDRDDGTRQLVFIDELPWLDTPKSGFIPAFEAFWNTWGCHRDNLMVIVCGSANSWIVDKLINNHGGLYNRLTYEIKLFPFTLSECEEYLESMGIGYSRYDIVQCYMILGGVPYYYSFFRPDYSVAQNIDLLFFSRQAKLRDEYGRLFMSVFRNPEYMMRIASFLSGKRTGFTRGEILGALELKEGSVFMDAMKGLLAGDFIEKYVPFGESCKDVRYRLLDPFCLFCNRFLGEGREADEGYWQRNLNSQVLNVWRGYAFEDVCFNHIPQIKKALEIGGVSSCQSGWIHRGNKERQGSQIDLLIERDDHVVNMCEMKFYNKEFVVDKQYYSVMLERADSLVSVIPRTHSVRTTLITTFGLKKNEYSGVFSKVLTLDDLFRK